MNLVLQKRQDIATMLFTTAFGSVFGRQRDVLWIDMPIDRKSGPVISEILLIQQKEMKAAIKAQPHIETLLTQIEPNTCDQFAKS